MKKNFFYNFLLIIISTLIALSLCELIIRINSPFSIFLKHYPLSLNKNELSTSQPQKFDSEIGYIYKENYYYNTHPNFGNDLFTTYSDSTRSNLYFEKKYFEEIKFQQPNFNKDYAIVVTGDSFVAGNEVANNNTWPAYLEKKLKHRVINGGVGGYSTIQAVLYGEKLLTDKKIKHLIVSLIPEDLVRAEHSIFQGVPRPFYKEIDNDQFIIERNHIEEFKNFSSIDKDYMGKMLNRYSRSFLIMEIIKRTSKNKNLFYYYGLHKKEDLRFDKIGCLLVNRLNDMKIKNNIKVAILLQYPDYYFYRDDKEQTYINKYFDNFKECISNSNLDLIDLYDPMLKKFKSNKKEFNSFYISRGRHMSPLGNNFVAKEIYNAINKEWY